MDTMKDNDRMLTVLCALDKNQYSTRDEQYEILRLVNVKRVVWELGKEVQQGRRPGDVYGLIRERAISMAARLHPYEGVTTQYLVDAIDTVVWDYPKSVFLVNSHRPASRGYNKIS